MQAKPHSAKSYLRHCLSIEYQPDAACPLYDRAIREIFAKAPDTAALTDLCHEIMGYALQPDRRTAIVVICKGGGSNGKTALIQTLIRLMGQELVTAMPVGDLDNHKFIIGSLLGKLLFVDDDVKNGTRLPDGQLKRLSEEKTVTGEHKFGPPFTFTVRTLPILLCNNAPTLSDLSHGMQRRLLVIPFDRTFKGSEVDRDLFPKIWAEELPGVLNHALAGLRRLVDRGWSFEPPQSAHAAKEAWLIEANPVPAFVAAQCERQGSCWMSELYPAYTSWASANGITKPQQQGNFKKNLEHQGFEVVHGNKGDKVRGLSLKQRPWPRRP